MIRAFRMIFIGSLGFLPVGFAVVTLATAIPSHVLAADKKVKTAVTGAGKTKSEAENEARKAASQISFSYTTVSKNTSGSGTNYVCTMVIEYTQK